MKKPFNTIDIKILSLKLLKYSELVYPVHNKGGAPIVDPEGTDEGQDQGQAGWDEAQHLVGEAHSLGCSQRRVPDLQDPLASSQRLLQAAIFRD